MSSLPVTNHVTFCNHVNVTFSDPNPVGARRRRTLVREMEGQAMDRLILIVFGKINFTSK